jgi:hypothetical protein
MTVVVLTLQMGHASSVGGRSYTVEFRQSTWGQFRKSSSTLIYNSFGHFFADNRGRYTSEITAFTEIKTKKIITLHYKTESGPNLELI